MLSAEAEHGADEIEASDIRPHGTDPILNRYFELLTRITNAKAITTTRQQSMQLVKRSHSLQTWYARCGGGMAPSLSSEAFLQSIRLVL